MNFTKHRKPSTDATKDTPKTFDSLLRKTGKSFLERLVIELLASLSSHPDWHKRTMDDIMEEHKKYVAAGRTCKLPDEEKESV